MSAELLKAADAGRRVKAIKRAAGAPDTLRGAAVATMDAWRKEVTAQAAAAKTAASSQKASKKASQKAAASPVEHAKTATNALHGSSTLGVGRGGPLRVPIRIPMRR